MAQVKRIRRKVDGIILLDKPHGFTSNAALQKVRWLLNAEKAGHTGSLDPLATGVLPLCFGEATKFSQYLLDADKGYETVAQLGVTTTTGDAEGDVIERRPVTVGRAEIEALLPRFRGEIKQIPPMYSALKKDGQRGLCADHRQHHRHLHQPVLAGTVAGTGSGRAGSGPSPSPVATVR